MKHSVRSWHTWMSVVLGIPLLLVGLTTFFIAHEKALGTKEMILPADFVKAEPQEIRSGARIDGALWIGTKEGVYRVDEGGRAQALAGGPKDEIRGLAPAGSAVLMAGKMGLWRYEQGRSEKLRSADCWQVSASPEGYSAACKDIGLLVSRDGRAWSGLPVELPAATEARGTPLSKVIMDIHTGKLFFGKNAEWIWIDVLGLSIVGLALTGLVLWMRARRARAASAALPGAPVRDTSEGRAPTAQPAPAAPRLV